MRKWSYKVVELPGELQAIEEQLESLGDVGWELVEIWSDQGRDVRVAVLKRPAPGLPQ